MAQIERGEARIQRRISIKKALDTKVLWILISIVVNKLTSICKYKSSSNFLKGKEMIKN